MQSSGISSLFCQYGKETSKIIRADGKEISIHFGKKSTYWHICDLLTGKIKRVFKIPSEWDC